jgi:hypothetical protein
MDNNNDLPGFGEKNDKEKPLIEDKDKNGLNFHSEP